VSVAGFRLGAKEGCVDQVLGQESGLLLVGGYHIIISFMH